MAGAGGEKWRVHCPDCGWRGVRTSTQCECYDEWRMYCRPNSPGPDCPSRVTWPCPKCGPNVERPILGPGTPMQRVWSTVRGVAPVAHRSTAVAR